MAIISTDIYDLAETVDEVQRQHMESESDRTRAIGINGYFNDYLVDYFVFYSAWSFSYNS